MSIFMQEAAIELKNAEAIGDPELTEKAKEKRGCDGVDSSSFQWRA
ncbi:hypothetical protein [Lysobacter antibioticus]|nr:hypothetical protein [Lysobacter antibioticus]